MSMPPRDTIWYIRSANRWLLLCVALAILCLSGLVCLLM